MANCHLCFLCLLAAVGGDDFDRETVEVRYRISEGLTVYIDEYPSMVQVEFFTNDAWIQECAANILNKFYVLSAVHCFDGIDPVNIRIRAGTTIRGFRGVVINVESFVIHPNYGKLDYDSDLVIVRLSSPLQFSLTIQPANIVKKGTELPDNTEVRAAGWGITSAGGPSSEFLQEITIYTINNDLCSRRSRNFSTPFVVTRNMICAGLLDIGGKDVCPGDSGGGLFHGNILVGIASWSQGCANPYFPGVYTNIAPYSDWIKSMIHDS